MRKFFFLFFLLVSIAFASEYRQMLYVTDGDTFRFTDLNCRIKSIDTPESAVNNRLKKKLKECPNVSKKEMLSAGKLAKRYAKRNFTSGAHYLVDIYGKGKWGRSICSVKNSKGEDYSIKSVQDGYSVPFFAFIDGIEKIKYKIALHEAKLAKRGLWATHREVMECLAK